MLLILLRAIALCAMNCEKIAGAPAYSIAMSSATLLLTEKCCPDSSFKKPPERSLKKQPAMVTPCEEPLTASA